VRLGIGKEFLKSRTPEEISTASGYAGGPTIRGSGTKNVFF